MAHHSATLKSIRQSAKRNERNVAIRSTVKTAIKKVVSAIEAKDATVAKAAFITAQSEIFKAVNKGIIKKQAAARKVSRLNASVKAIAA